MNIRTSTSFFLMKRRTPKSKITVTLFPDRTIFQSDIQRVAVRRVLGAGAGPQQTRWPRARLLRELLPARRREDVAVVLVGQPRIGDRNRPEQRPQAKIGRAHV